MLNKPAPIQYAIAFSFGGAVGGFVVMTLLHWTQPDNTLSYLGLVGGGILGGFAAGFTVGTLKGN